MNSTATAQFEKDESVHSVAITVNESESIASSHEEIEVQL